MSFVAALGVRGRSSPLTAVARRRGSRWTSRFRRLAAGGHRRTWSRRGEARTTGGRLAGGVGPAAILTAAELRRAACVLELELAVIGWKCWRSNVDTPTKFLHPLDLAKHFLVLYSDWLQAYEKRIDSRLSEQWPCCELYTHTRHIYVWNSVVATPEPHTPSHRTPIDKSRAHPPEL